MTIRVREARGEDVEEIRQIFIEAYGEDYPYQHFYDQQWLMHSIYGDHLVMLVAEEEESGQVLGTGSVDFDIGIHSDLVGEFGRLAVHEDARGRGVGKMIMDKRIEFIESRLHVGIVDNRTNHVFSQKISERYGFGVVGFLPLKHHFHQRESIASYARHFGQGLAMRRNHPRVVAPVALLAQIAMDNVGLSPDVIVDEIAPAYPDDQDFQLTELEALRMPDLLRIARGRVTSREVFGPMRLHHGFFKLAANHANYLLARRPGAPEEALSGGLGFLHHPVEKTIQVFELISASDDAVRFLFQQLLDLSRQWEVEYLEVEVSAHATRLQRTLCELGFLPAAYVPAMVFQDVERLDVIKMVRLLVPADFSDVQITESVRPMFDAVKTSFETQAVLPEIAAHLDDLALFSGLSDEQARRLASAMTLRRFQPRENLFQIGDRPDELFVLLNGEVAVTGAQGNHLGDVRPGQVVGENALLAEGAHSASAHAIAQVSAAVLSLRSLQTLSTNRPDIAVNLYRNLARALGTKLRQLDHLIDNAEENRSSD